MPTTCIVCLAGHALTGATYSLRKNDARTGISIRRKGVIAFVALRKLSRPIATWAAWEIILRCGEREPADRRTEVEPLSRRDRKLGNEPALTIASGTVSLLTREFFRQLSISRRFIRIRFTSASNFDELIRHITMSSISSCFIFYLVSLLLDLQNLNYFNNGTKTSISLSSFRSVLILIFENRLMASRFISFNMFE